MDASELSRSSTPIVGELQALIRRLVVAFILTVVAATAVGTVLTLQGPSSTTSSLDDLAQSVASLHRNPWLAEAMRFVTAFGNDGPMAILFILAAVWTYRSTRDRRWPMLFLFASAGGLALDNAIKPLVARPRPDFERLVGGNGFSFPSGHVTATAVLCVAAAYFLTQRKGAPPFLTWASAAAIVSTMAFSRVFLGVHWPTDVIGAAILGGIWAVISGAIAGFARPARDPRALVEADTKEPVTAGTAT